MVKFFKEFWNFLLYLIIGNERCLFESPNIFPMDEPMCQVKAIPFAETGCVDENGHEHKISKVYTCSCGNCKRELEFEIPEDTIKRPLGEGQPHEISSDVIYHEKGTNTLM